MFRNLKVFLVLIFFLFLIIPSVQAKDLTGAYLNPITCTETKPTTPTNLNASTLAPGLIHLTWSRVSPKVIHYNIYYSDNPSQQKFSVLNINSTSVDINVFKTGTFYFWVRAVNGCQSGDLSKITSTYGGISITGDSFKPEVGDLNYLSTGSFISQQLNSVSIKADGTTCSNCLWWPLLITEILDLSVLYYLFYYYLRKYKPYFTGSIFAISIYLIFRLINISCLGDNLTLSSNYFCQYFWLMDLLILGVISFIYSGYRYLFAFPVLKEG